MREFKKSVEINCSLSRAFDFHKDTNNLKLITPPGISVEIEKIELPLGLGSEVVLSVTQFRIFRNKWHLKLTEFVENNLITDTQISGPFRFWEHRHIFEEIEAGTKMTDEITYELPFGFLGIAADTLLVSGLISSQFEYRHKVTKNLLEGGGI